MKLYENIKYRREKLNLSHDELAKLTGYTDETFISKIESGEIDLPQSKIPLFAQALQTTERELMDAISSTIDSKADSYALSTDSLEEQLKFIILSRNKSVNEFANAIGVPQSTIASIFKRGIDKAGVKTVLKIFNALDLDIGSISTGKLMKSNIQQKLQELKDLSGKSQDEIAMESGIPKSTVAKIFAGITKSPSLETVKSIIYAMGFSLADLDDVQKSEEKTILNAETKQFIKKYRSLDEHGRKIVDAILDIEYERMVER